MWSWRFDYSHKRFYHQLDKPQPIGCNKLSRIARSYPKLCDWMQYWVDQIAKLYHINHQRLPHWNPAVPLAAQSIDFNSQQVVLELPEIRSIIVLEFVEISLHRRVALSEFLDGHILRFVVRKAKVSISTEEGILRFLKVVN
jgi:phosphoribulokinase